MIIFTIILAIVLAAATISLSIYKKKTKYDNEKKIAGIIRNIVLSVGIVLFIVIFIARGLRIVDTTEIGVVKRFGNLSHTISSGLNFVNPFCDSVSYIDLRVHVKEVHFASYTKDAQPVTAAVEYQYEPDSAQAMEIVKQFGSYEILETKLTNVVEERAKIVVARYGAMSLLENRSNLSNEVRAEVEELEDQFPVNFTSVVMRDVDFSDAFEAAVEQKMEAEQTALRAENEKKAAVTRAEQEKEVATIKAQSEIEVARAQAEAEIEKARGEAEALNITREALANMPDAYIESLWISRWNGETPQYIVGNSEGLIVNPGIQ